MGTVELKKNLHELIDGIENTNLLESLYEMLSEHKRGTKGELWESLTDSQKKEVMDAYEESESAHNLIPHSEVLRKL